MRRRVRGGRRAALRHGDERGALAPRRGARLRGRVTSSDGGGLDAASRATVRRGWSGTPSSRVALHPPSRAARASPGLAFVVRASARRDRRAADRARRRPTGSPDSTSSSRGRRRRSAARARVRSRHAGCVLRAPRKRGARRPRVTRRTGGPVALVASGWASVRGERARSSGRHPARPRRSGERRTVVRDALAGRIALEHYRGRTAYTAREQAAERVVRESRGLVARVGPRARRRRRHRGAVRATRTGTSIGAFPRSSSGPAVPASCGAEPEPQAAPHRAGRLTRATPPARRRCR